MLLRKSQPLSSTVIVNYGREKQLTYDETEALWEENAVYTGQELKKLLGMRRKMFLKEKRKRKSSYLLEKRALWQLGEMWTEEAVTGSQRWSWEKNQEGIWGNWSQKRNLQRASKEENAALHCRQWPSSSSDVVMGKCMLKRSYLYCIARFYVYIVMLGP